MVQCQYCSTAVAVLKRPKTSEKICKACFFDAFEREVHETIVANQLFVRGERVAIAASGGKDSTVLAHVLTTLNKRHDYGLNLFLLSIDEGITGYRDDSLESVKRNQIDYGIPLQILSYKDLYGWTMDEIVAEIGLKNNCTFCGVFRRQALDRGAVLLKADKIVTGHNCDDMAETVLMNLLRGDIARLERCVAITTGKDSSLPRCKPFKYSYEKEIVMYAYYKKLDYFSTECIYSPNAYRGFAREFLKELEKVKSRSIVDIVRSGEHFKINRELLATTEKKGGLKATTPIQEDESKDEDNTCGGGGSSVSSSVVSVDSSSSKRVGQSSGKRVGQSLGKCERCNYISSNRICKACVLLEGLNKGKAKVRIGGGEDPTSETPTDLTALPSREQISSVVGRVPKTRQPIQLESESKESDNSLNSTSASSSTVAPTPNTTSITKQGKLSATMDMAQKLNATSW